MLIGICAGVTLFASVSLALLPETRTLPLERLNGEHCPEHVEVCASGGACGRGMACKPLAFQCRFSLQTLRPWQRQMLGHAVRTEAPTDSRARLESHKQPSSARDGLHKGSSLASQLPPIIHSMQATKPVVLPSPGTPLSSLGQTPAPLRIR